jgi:hypothetical protein
MAATSSFSLRWIAWESLFCDRWIRNTIRNVTIVVPVLMTSCHVSENPKIGPLISQTRMVRTARPNAVELPVQLVAKRESVANRCSRGAGSVADMA